MPSAWEKVRKENSAFREIVNLLTLEELKTLLKRVEESKEPLVWGEEVRKILKDSISTLEGLL